MIITSLLNALLLGSSSGTLYGLIFLAQKRNLFNASQTTVSRWQNLLRSFCFTAARFLPLLLILFSILLSPTINHILLITSFFGMFWLVILKKGLPR